MTLSAVGSPITFTATGWSLTPGAVGNVIGILAWTDNSATPVTALASSNVTWTNVAQVTTGLNGYAFTAFKGVVTSTTPEPVTVTGGDTAAIRAGGIEIHSTLGASAITFDKSAVLNNTTATKDWASITPGHGAGEFLVGYEFNENAATAGTNGTPAGMVYTVDTHSNGFAYGVLPGSGAAVPVWGDTDQRTAMEVLFYEGLGVTAATPDEVSSSVGVASSVTSFSPLAGSMVRVCAGWLDETDLLGKTFTCADSHGNSYALTLQGGDADGGCYLLIFDYVYATAPGATTVTITCSNTAAADCLIQPYLITGQASNQSTAAHNSFSEVGTATSTYEISLPTTAAGSAVFVLAAPNNNNHPVPVPLASTQTDIDWDDDGVGSHAVIGRSASLTGTPGATTFGWTSVVQSLYGYGVMAAEVLPAVSGGTPHTATASLTVTPTRSVSRTHGHHRTASLTVTPTRAAAAALSVPAVPGSPILDSAGGGMLDSAGVAILDTAEAITASLTVTPSFTVSAGHGHSRSASLTVTPSATSTRRHGHSRSAALTVTPSRTSASRHGHSRSASLTVTPARTITASRGQYRAASLTVTPTRSTSRLHNHGRSASLTATPVMEASTGSGVPHNVTASLSVTVSRVATARHGHSRAASLTVSPVLSAARAVARAHTAAASLTVTPTRTASRRHANVRSASHTVNPVLSASPDNAQVWPDYYTTNFNPNPSVESGTTGYSPLAGTEQVSQVTTAFSGLYGLQVSTPGQVPGEGVATPHGSVIASVTGSMSLYIFGDTGTLTVAAVQTPGGQVLGSVQVQPDPAGWQRVELDQLAMTARDDVFLMVYTTTAQALTFTIDAVQYEPESPAHPYVDGDQPYTTAGAPSYQQYQNPTSASGGMTLEGAIEITVHGTVTQVGPVAGQMDMSGVQFPMCAVTATGRTVIAPAIDTGVIGTPWVISGGGTITSVVVVTPGSGFAQFAVYSSADPDPAMTLIGANNAGTDNASDTTGSYTQIYGTFTPPQQQLDSNGNALWQAAAYMAAGFRIASQGKWVSGTPNGVNFTQVQVEKATGTTPSAYLRPRSLSTIVKPTNMNFITNPSMEAGITGWTAVGGATLTQVASAYQGSYSLQVSVPSAGGGVSIEIPELIFGDVFNASAYVNPTSGNIVDITLAAGGASVSANPTGYPFGSATFGSGPYGGVNTASAPMASGWNYRPWTAFTAPASTVTLTLTPVAVSGATYPLVFNVDCVMVAPGEVLTAYGDGSTDQWQWELGGTPGLSRSYYYERESAAANAVQSVLGQHIPLGLTAYAPVFGLPYTQ